MTRQVSLSAIAASVMVAPFAVAPWAVAQPAPKPFPPVLPPLASPSQPAATPPKVRPVLITQADFDINRDGKKDTLYIQMIAGRRYTDTNPWCGQGDKYEGIFQLVVNLTGHAEEYTDKKGKKKTRYIRNKTIVQNLNTLYGEKARPEMFFRPGRWKLIFDNYTSDGSVTFNIGQFHSCEGWAYKVFRVQPDGKVVSLHPTGTGFWIRDFVNSTQQMRPSGGGFCTKTYDAEITTGELPRVEDRCYRWDQEKLGFVLNTPVGATP